MSDWELRPEIRTGTGILRIRAALSYEPSRQLGAPYAREGPEVAVQFSPGLLHAVLE